jgi:hypothetical protein
MKKKKEYDDDYEHRIHPAWKTKASQLALKSLEAVVSNCPTVGSTSNMFVTEKIKHSVIEK